MICQRVFHQQSDSSQMTQWSTWQLHLMRMLRNYSQTLISLQIGKTNGWWNSTQKSAMFLPSPKNRNVIKKDYILHGHRLEHITSAKYLGVRLTSDMKWTQHINNICAKANSTIGFLKRNININNRDIKEKAYKSLVRPTVEYASAAWNPHQKTDVQKIEMVQRRAARFVQNRYHNTSSVTEMLEQLEWQTLEERRKIASLSIMYKMMNDKLNIDVTGKLKPQERPSRNSNSRALQIPSCRTTVRKESFYPRNIKEWKRLAHRYHTGPKPWFLQGPPPPVKQIVGHCF